MGVLYEKEKLLNIINYYKEHIEQAQVDILLVRKTHSSKKKFKGYMFECANNDIKNTVIKSLDNLIAIISKRKIDEYDLELSADNSVQTVSVDKVIHFEEIVKQITTVLTDENTLKDSNIFDKIDFDIIQITLPDYDVGKIFLCKKHINLAGKFKESTRYTFNGEEFKVLKDEILVFGTNVESIELDDYFYVVNRNSFNSMFDYKDVYTKVIEENTKAIQQSNIVDNADQFIEDCKTDGRYAPRLTKAILTNVFANVINNKDRLSKIKENYGLKIELSDDNTIAYHDRKDIPEILNVLLEHYVTSALTDNKMLAKAIEKYSI